MQRREGEGGGGRDEKERETERKEWGNKLRFREGCGRERKELERG